MPSTRSTSPPKSAWPGVSTMLMRVPFQVTAVHLERIVMPRSRSRSLLSSARSATTSPVRNVPACLSRPSTSVVLPWSTCAMIATLRMGCCCVDILRTLREDALASGNHADLGRELGCGEQRDQHEILCAGRRRGGLIDEDRAVDAGMEVADGLAGRIGDDDVAAALLNAHERDALRIEHRCRHRIADREHARDRLAVSRDRRAVLL